MAIPIHSVFTFLLFSLMVSIRHISAINNRIDEPTIIINERDQLKFFGTSTNMHTAISPTTFDSID